MRNLFTFVTPAGEEQFFASPQQISALAFAFDLAT
jgi:hypothetical protein